MGTKGLVFQAWVHKRVPKTHNGWYLALVEPIPPLIVRLLILSS